MKTLNDILLTRIKPAKTIILLLLLLSCKGSYYSSTPKWNLSAIYNPTRSSIHPSYKVYHSTTNSSVVFLKVFTNELQYQPLGTGGKLICDFSLEYTLFESSEEKSITDSGTYNYKLNKESLSKSFITQVPVKADTGKSYSLKLIMRDNHRKTFNLTFIDVEKRPGFGQQFFNISNFEGSPLFRNIIIGNGLFRVQHPAPSSDKLYVSYYKNKTPLPKPTFAVAGDDVLYNKRDSLFIINYNPEQPITLSYEGLYFIQFDTAQAEGVSIARFSEGFPKVTEPKELIKPLAYITTSGEYDKLLTRTNSKLAADEFWIKSGGSTNRGREMIRIYYNRVYFANYYFTSTVPGWKTDRGMIYTVYGPPHNIKKTTESETWLYYRKGSGESISFTFKYSPGKFHLSQYRLERSEGHNWHWREAVYAWKNGKIFLLD